jgi:hypothetical protein
MVQRDLFSMSATATPNWTNIQGNLRGRNMSSSWMAMLTSPYATMAAMNREERKVKWYFPA